MKDYKKILEGVVNIINTAEKSDIGFTNICTYIGENCPELKESEDEKIRKFLIKWIQDNYYHGTTEIPTKTLIAWLEKQRKEDSSIQQAYEYGYTEGKRIERKHWLEKQGKQKLPIEKLPFEMKTIGESLGFTTQEECDKYNQMVSELIMSDDSQLPTS